VTTSCDALQGNKNLLIFKVNFLRPNSGQKTVFSSEYLCLPAIEFCLETGTTTNKKKKKKKK
jgi:hypothetical protein